jgi:hypothetical protein
VLQARAGFRLYWHLNALGPPCLSTNIGAHSHHQTKNFMPKDKQPDTITNRYNMENGRFAIIGAKRVLTVPEMRKIYEDWLIEAKKAAAQAVEDRLSKSKSVLIYYKGR